MGRTYRGKDREKNKDNYLRFKDKRNKRSIQDDDKGNGKKNDYKRDYDEREY